MSLGRRRTKQILIRVTPSELHQLTENAQVRQIDLSRYLREAGLTQDRSRIAVLSLQQQMQQLVICLYRIYHFHQRPTASGFDIDAIFEQILTIAHRIEQDVNLLSANDDREHDCH
ncbi:MAG: hypothetical protein MUF49_10715 [Oculatellaceae cyanobacterium Prado106]|jgi:hypothetical protein|nr:hypothetical protein [Oculatellaceae cyanobacterium Prado106]